MPRVIVWINLWNVGVLIYTCQNDFIVICHVHRFVFASNALQSLN